MKEENTNLSRMNSFNNSGPQFYVFSANLTMDVKLIREKYIRFICGVSD